jgi:signal transduction histidine kinase
VTNRRLPETGGLRAPEAERAVAEARTRASTPTPREIDVWMYELMARLAHDMRAPLSAIRIWSQMLRMGSDADRTAALDAIDASTRWQSEMIAFLNDTAQVVVGRLPIEQRPCDLRAALRAGIESCLREARDRDVSLDVELVAPEGEALIVTGDERRLRQAFGCVLGAAVFRSPGGGAVVARLRPPGASRAAVLVVQVAAAGLTEPELQDLFTPYRPGKADMGRPLRDFGLGLAFARGMFRLHGGDLSGLLTGEGDERELVLTVELPLEC